MTQAPSPFITKLTKFFPLAEMVLLTAAAAGLALHFYSIDSNVLFLALNGLSIIYFLTAYLPIDIKREEGQRLGFAELLSQSIVPKVVWISITVSVVGILFSLLNFAGSLEMLLIGASSVGIGLLLIAVLFVTGVKNLNVHVPMIYRAIPIFILDLYLLLVQNS